MGSCAAVSLSGLAVLIACGGPPPARPASALPPAAASAGVAPEPAPALPLPATIRIACPSTDGACRLSGRLIAIRDDAVPAARGLAATSGLRLTVDGDACAPIVELGGVAFSTEHGPGAGWPGPAVLEIFVALPDTYPPLSLELGDCITAAVDGIGCGYDPTHQAVLAQDGVVLVAYAPDLPRDGAPIAGWTFARGALRSSERTAEDYWLDRYDVLVTHAGRTDSIAGDGTVLRYSDGAYLVETEAYGIRGVLPPWAGWMQQAGYRFALVRDDG